MKRGRRPSPNPRTRKIMIRMTPVDLMLVTKAAAPLPVSTWARGVLMGAAMKTNSA